MRRAEEILVTTLAAYGLLKILESIVCPPRPAVVIVGDGEASEVLREFLDDPETGE
ncbi:hypothetical protein [Deinococcus sp. KSM4-11]|uniref:hypothetical protein n=1 Tax=Deinococcus sp. KSM4-11 TaxID=2568654 RepID=UPI001454CD61|nr:hypothetical protein [Deinococcus sp. KSM4-11]